MCGESWGVRQAERPSRQGLAPQSPKPRLVPLINGADRSLRWFIEDVLGLFDVDLTGRAVPLFPSERKNIDGSCMRATADVYRRSLAEAADRHLPAWSGKLTPHVLRHFCASRLYLGGMNLFAIQELLGHYAGDPCQVDHVVFRYRRAAVAGERLVS